jgi:cytochrome c-type biogenesis protein CcsB
MAEFSYFLFWTGLLCATASAVFYVWYAVGSRSLTFVAETGSGSATVSGEQHVAPAAGSVASGLMLAGTLALGGAVMTRAAATDRPPYGDLWEYFQALAFGTLSVYAYAEWRSHEKGAGAVVLPLIAVMLLGGELLLPHEISPLVPALRNNRLLAIHVATMLLAYSALTVAFGAGLVVAIQGPGSVKRIERLPEGGSVWRLMDRLIMVGFPLLGLGIVLGAYWGNIAWGRYWGWDPKETTALVSWLVYAVYMHVRHIAGWRERALLIALAGYGCVLFNIFAVNFVLSGLHSYAGA